MRIELTNPARGDKWHPTAARTPDHAIPTTSTPTPSNSTPGSEHAQGASAANRVSSVRRPELAVDGALVGLHGVDRHVELRRDLGVRQAAREVPQDGAL